MFNWDEFRNEKVAVNCDTEEKAKEFVKECHKRGMKWEKCTENQTMFDWYKNDTCYNFETDENENRLMCCDKSYYERKNYKIIKWESENMKFKVGDKVRAIDDKYLFTNKTKGFIGKVIEVLDEYSPVEYKDLYVQDLNSSTTYKVNSKHFELVEEPTEFTFQEVIARIKQGETYEAVDGVYATQTITMEEDKEIRIDILSSQTFIMPTYSLFKLQEPKKRVRIYKIEHQKNGKKYDFISSQLLDCDEFVICDTKCGKSYGRIANVNTRELTESEYKQYKGVGYG